MRYFNASWAELGEVIEDIEPVANSDEKEETNKSPIYAGVKNKHEVTSTMNMMAFSKLSLKTVLPSADDI
jgi:hypothetical protein